MDPSPPNDHLFQTANLYPPPSRKQQTLHTGALTSALQNLEAGGERKENQKAGGETDGGVTPWLPPDLSILQSSPSEPAPFAQLFRQDSFSLANDHASVALLTTLDWEQMGGRDRS